MSDVDRLVAALQRDEVTLDDVTRARSLAQMAPTIDAIAGEYASARAPRPRRAPWLWLGAAAAAAVIAIVGWRITGRAPNRVDHAMSAATTARAPIERDRHVLAPYVVGGVSPDVATTLLDGAFASLDVPTGLVRANVAGDRIGLVGPARVVVAAVHDADVELAVDTGTLLVDATGSTALRIHAGGHEVVARAAHIVVRVASSAQTMVVFVDRGEVTLDGASLAAGQWFGPIDERSPALVAMIRDHGNAIAPPVGRAGLVAVDGSGELVATEAGAVIGTAPVWARVPAGPLALVATGTAGERRATVEVRDGITAHVAAVAPAIEPTPTSPPRVPAATHAMTPTPVAPPTPIETDATAVSASTLYAAAERDLGAGQRATAEQALIDLLAQFPTSPQAASALYDLAGIARARGEYAKAIAWLDRLLAAQPPTSVREPAAYLRCRIRVDAGDDAAPCFRGFRVSFPDSPHDAEVLAWLAGDAGRGGCAGASALAAEYVRRYPDGAFAARARTLAACEPKR